MLISTLTPQHRKLMEAAQQGRILADGTVLPWNRKEAPSASDLEELKRNHYRKSADSVRAWQVREKVRIQTDLNKALQPGNETLRSLGLRQSTTSGPLATAGGKASNGTSKSRAPRQRVATPKPLATGHFDLHHPYLGKVRVDWIQQGPGFVGKTKYGEFRAGSLPGLGAKVRQRQQDLIEQENTQRFHPDLVGSDEQANEFRTDYGRLPSAEDIAKVKRDQIERDMKSPINKSTPAVAFTHFVDKFPGMLMSGLSAAGGGPALTNRDRADINRAAKKSIVYRVAVGFMPGLGQAYNMRDALEALDELAQGRPEKALEELTGAVVSEGVQRFAKVTLNRVVGAWKKFNATKHADDFVDVAVSAGMPRSRAEELVDFKLHRGDRVPSLRASAGPDTTKPPPAGGAIDWTNPEGPISIPAVRRTSEEDKHGGRLLVLGDLHAKSKAPNMSEAIAAFGQLERKFYTGKGAEFIAMKKMLESMPKDLLDGYFVSFLDDLSIIKRNGKQSFPLGAHFPGDIWLGMGRIRLRQELPQAVMAHELGHVFHRLLTKQERDLVYDLWKTQRDAWDDKVKKLKAANKKVPPMDYRLEDEFEWFAEIARNQEYVHRFLVDASKAESHVFRKLALKVKLVSNRWTTMRELKGNRK